MVGTSSALATLPSGVEEICRADLGLRQEALAWRAPCRRLIARTHADFSARRSGAPSRRAPQLPSCSTHQTRPKVDETDAALQIRRSLTLHRRSSVRVKSRRAPDLGPQAPWRPRETREIARRFRMVSTSARADSIHRQPPLDPSLNASKGRSYTLPFTYKDAACLEILPVTPPPPPFSA